MPRISTFYSPARLPWPRLWSPRTVCSGGGFIVWLRRASSSKASSALALACTPAPRLRAHAPNPFPATLVLPVAFASAWSRTVVALPCGCARRATSQTLPVRLASSRPARRSQNIPAIVRARRRVPPPARRDRENAALRETKLSPPLRSGIGPRLRKAAAFPVATHPDPRRRRAASARSARRAPTRGGVDAKAGSGSGRAACDYYPLSSFAKSARMLNNELLPWPRLLLSIPAAPEKTQGAFMPATGELIRHMNYIDDIATTLRRISASIPAMTKEECARLGEYIRKSEPSYESVVQRLETAGKEKEPAGKE